MGARIGKVKFKSGGEIKILPQSNSNYVRISIGWGEIVVRCYDGEPITNETLLFMLEAAKHEVLYD